MARKKSLIPVKLQVPAAFVLAIVFVSLLVFRAMKSEGDTKATVQAANLDVYAIDVPKTLHERMPVNDLRNLIFNFQDKSESESEPVLPLLTRNPFLIPDDAFTRALPDQADFDEELELRSGSDRSQVKELNSIVLTGTSKIGDRYMAIVDGMVLGEGDRIAGYTIVEVGEGILYLENRRSARIVRMKEGGGR